MRRSLRAQVDVRPNRSPNCFGQYSVICKRPGPGAESADVNAGVELERLDVEPEDNNKKSIFP